MRTTSLLALAAGLILAACGGDDRTAEAAEPREAEAQRPDRSEDIEQNRLDEERALAGDSLSDAGIEVLVSLVNGAEISAAKALENKLVTPQAQEYARMLLEDHTAVRQAMPTLERDGGPPPQWSTMNAIIHAQSGMFSTLPAGQAFDVFFLVTQEGTHAMVLDSLHHWLTLTEDDQLRGAIRQAIQGVEKHLQRARA